MLKSVEQEMINNSTHSVVKYSHTNCTTIEIKESLRERERGSKGLSPISHIYAHVYMHPIGLSSHTYSSIYIFFALYSFPRIYRCFRANSALYILVHREHGRCFLRWISPRDFRQIAHTHSFVYLV